MNRENARNKVNSAVERLETEFSNGNVTKKLLEETINTVKNLAVLAGYTGPELREYRKRIEKIVNSAVDNVVETPVEKPVKEAIHLTAEPGVTTRSVKAKKSIFNRLRVRAAALATALAVTFGAGYGVAKLNDSNVNTQIATTAEAADGKDAEKEEVATEEKQEKTEMDAEYQELADKALAFAQEELEKGVPADMKFTDKNKAKLVKSLVNYYMLNQVDELTDEQWANIYQNSTTSAEDLMDAKFAWEWVDEQRVTVTDKHLDYKLLFDENDAEFLNKGAKLLNNVKGNDKSAITKFKDYVIENLRSDDNNILYSERALDTFRAVYFDAFDELTNHAEIDDELEHAVNTTITCAVPESDLNVEDKTINSLQSEYETYEMKKVETRLQAGWNFVAINKDDINEYNDIEHISEYVASKLDLSKQVILPDYEEFLTNMFLGSVGGSGSLSKDDSGISDGHGGVISKSDMAAYGATTKEEYEQAVRNATKGESKVIDAHGNVTGQSKESYAADYKEGYEDGNGGKKRQSGRSTAYNDGYDKGAADRKALDESLGDGSKTETEKVDNGKEVVTETDPKTDDYTEQPKVEEPKQEESTPAPEPEPTPASEPTPAPEQPKVEEPVIETPAEPGETFVPVDSNEEVVEETEVVTEDYTYDESGDIAALKALKSELLASVDNDLNASKTLS